MYSLALLKKFHQKIRDIQIVAVAVPDMVESTVHSIHGADRVSQFVVRCRMYQAETVLHASCPKFARENFLKCRFDDSAVSVMLQWVISAIASVNTEVGASKAGTVMHSLECGPSIHACSEICKSNCWLGEFASQGNVPGSSVSYSSERLINVPVFEPISQEVIYISCVLQFQLNLCIRM